MKKGTILGILAILVILGAGWFVFSKSGGNNDQPQNAVTAPERTTTVEIVTPEARISTAGWKTCRNTEYGYEFMYPGDWHVSSQVLGNASSTNDCNGAYVYVGIQDPNPSESGIGMASGPRVHVITTDKGDVENMFTVTDGENGELYYVDKENKSKLFSFLFESPEKKRFVKVGTEFELWYTGEPVWLNRYFVSHADKFLYIRPVLAVADSHGEALPPELEDTILSTFKFIED